MSANIMVDDIGTLFKLTIVDENGDAVDISSATTKQIVFKKPDNTILTVTGSFFTDGTDAILSYATVSGDIDQAGGWRAQAYVVLDTGSFHSSVLTFFVGCNL